MTTKRSRSEELKRELNEQLLSASAGLEQARAGLADIENLLKGKLTQSQRDDLADQRTKLLKEIAETTRVQQDLLTSQRNVEARLTATKVVIRTLQQELDTL